MILCFHINMRVMVANSEKEQKFAKWVLNFGCRNPTLAKCGGEAQHLEKVGIGVVATRAFGLRLKQGG
jgi:hypothetical protein